ncbi:PKD domain-containing protein [Vibrio sp. JC009]|uniref:hypothetical protein n=1 Tax=Vibrio sp. JC009 TaxID=2912314 RepID=UPI0023B033B9|nr:hypothetical protein [Vibrio sp. JC009]WED22341.1 PKD domain-containing protein [Vibrio sp. JC009]
MKDLIPKILLIVISIFVITGCEDNAPPTIDGIKENYVIAVGGELDLKAVISDADGGTLTIAWKQTLGDPLWNEDPTGSEATLKIPTQKSGTGVYAFEIRVSDGIDSAVHKSVLTVLPLASEHVIPWDCQRAEVCTDIQFNLRDISPYGVYDKSANKFEIELTSESGAVFDFSELTDLTLFYGRNVKEIQDLFDFSELNNLLYVKEDKISEFNELLSYSHEQNSLFISGKDTSGFDVTKEVFFYYGHGSIKGTFVDKEHKVLSNLEGQLVQLRGTSKTQRITYYTLVKSDGSFEFKGLQEDQYFISMPESNDMSVFEEVEVSSGTPNLNVNIEVMWLSELHKSILIGNDQTISNRADSYYSPPPSLIGSFESANEEENLVSDTGVISVPKDTKELVLVSYLYLSEVYVQSDRADFELNWHMGYTVGEDKTIYEGKSSETHEYNEGSKFFCEVVRFDENLKKEPINIKLFSKTENTGKVKSNAYVNISVYDSFEEVRELCIKDFSMKEGLGLGLKKKWYIGLGKNTTRSWKAQVSYDALSKGIEVDVEQCKFIYEDSELDIDIHNVNSVRSGRVEFEMRFSGSTVPDEKIPSGKIRCDFSGTDPEEKILTLHARAVMKMPDEQVSLIPLYHYPYGKRYGAIRDIGGDSWMQFSTMNQMKQLSSLAYNDASREHGGLFTKDNFYYSHYNIEKEVPYSKYRHDHFSHRDGTSVDTLYPTSTMLNPKTKLKNKLDMSYGNPGVAKEVRDWVLEMRAEVDAITARETVKLVYIDDRGWFKKLVTMGVDSKGREIEGLGKWETKSLKVKHLKGHLDHVHIEFYPTN